MQYLEDNPSPGSFSVWLSSIFCSLTVARGSLSNARNRLQRGEIYSGLKCRKEGYIFQFNYISRLQRYSLRDDCEEVIPWKKRAERELKMISARHILRQILLAFVSMASKTLGEKERKIRSKSIGRRD